MSAFDEYIAKYREISNRNKYLLLVFLGIMPGLLTYFDNITLLQEDLYIAENNHNKRQNQYNRAKKKKDQLPKLEEQLTSTEIQLKDASSRLPDIFVIDKILQKIALISSELGIRISKFDPMKAIPSKTAFKYAQLPISLEMSGTYTQIATFFDRLAHLKLLIHIRDFEIVAMKGAPIPNYLLENLRGGNSFDSDSESFKQKWVRKHALLSARSKIVIYRSLSDEEQKKLDDVIAAEKEKSKKANRRARRRPRS